MRVQFGIIAVFTTLMMLTPAQATTVREMHLMCRDYESKAFNVVTKPHAYCAGYFQSQIQSASALCRTLKILFREKPDQRDVIMGTASLFGSSATAKDYRTVITAFNTWADGKDDFKKKNPALFLHNYLSTAFPCRPDLPDNDLPDNISEDNTQ